MNETKLTLEAIEAVVRRLEDKRIAFKPTHVLWPLKAVAKLFHSQERADE